MKKELGKLAAISSQTKADEQSILKAALRRLSVVQGGITGMDGRVMSGSDAEKGKYLSLIKERGKLNLIIARCEKNLA